jgi:hypothetical protein
MKEKTANLKQKSKKIYTKPELKHVPLRPQDFVRVRIFMDRSSQPAQASAWFVILLDLEGAA